MVRNRRGLQTGRAPTFPVPTFPCWIALAGALATVLAARPATAAASAQDAVVECHTLSGRPLGVGRVFLPGNHAEPALGLTGLKLTESGGRVLYTVVEHRQRGLLLNRRRPPGTSIYFLFRGEQPLDLTVHLRPAAIQLTADPRRGTAEGGELLSLWWQAYTHEAERRIDDSHYPPVLETYLTSMLARRMRLPPPAKPRERRRDSKPLETAELVGGAERLRMSVLRQSLSGEPSAEAAASPLPSPIPWQPLPELATNREVAIEPLALVAPRECFYVRFGKFSNFLWMTHLIREQGGDINTMVFARGLKQDLRSRFETQFAIRYSFIADLFGDQVVSDLAVIGNDLYLADGASMGMLLEARSPTVLNLALARERAVAMVRNRSRGVTQTTVKIANRDVDLVATPDNAVRSFSARHEKYYLVANSRHLVEQFFAVIDGATPLGATNEFRHARSFRPLSHDDTLFAYFSTDFLHSLVSPRYLIELRRRMQSVADLQMVELAELAAAQEGLPADLASLAAEGLLPRGAEPRPDGSQLKQFNDQWIDSVRGARGAFLPITDTPLESITAEEGAYFQELADYYQATWQHMDPLVAAVRHVAEEGRRERLTIDARISPFVEDKYGLLLSMLGEPTPVRITTPPNAVVSGQLSVDGGPAAPAIPPHNLFFGVVDQRPRVDTLQADGLLDKLRLLKAIPGYLGAWPRPGFLDSLPLINRRRIDEDGFSRVILGLWQRRDGDLSVLSFDRDLIGSVSPHLHPQESKEVCQGRLSVKDLTNTQLAPWLNDVSRSRSTEISRANADLLELAARQFGAPSDESAVKLLERLFDRELVCPLEGRYERANEQWISTAWRKPPTDYTAPLLSWFRGADIRLTHVNSQLILHAEVVLQRQ